MATIKEKRKRIEDLVIGAVSRLERGDENTKRYQAFFKSMTDEEFAEWADKFQKDKFDQVIQIYVEPYNEPRMNEIEACADFLGVPLTEYIYYRDHGEPPVRSKMKVPVGYASIKRVQQLLSKKNHYTFDNDERSIKTNQATGESKVASMTEPEVSALTAIEANENLRELLGFRADDAYGKMQAYKQIVNQGYISMDDLEKDQSNANQTTETIDTYLTCAGLKTDLVSSTLKTRYTIDQELKEKKS